VKNLVWFEGTGSIEAAIQREKQIKRWRRDWKLALIQNMNPRWRDLYPDIL
jgi:putative endonuclease